MELVMEIVNHSQFVPAGVRRKTFNQTGGVIGRGEGCEWVIPDRKRQVSKHHATISYRDGIFFLTDTSRNGVLDCRSGALLRKGEATRIEQDGLYRLGDFEIRARLVRAQATFDTEVGRPCAAGSTIPDDAFLDLDPLHVLDHPERVPSEFNPIGPDPAIEDTWPLADPACIDREHLMVPQLVNVRAQSVPEPSKRQGEGFWAQFGAALGVNLDACDDDACEALALNAARLLRQSIDGLQQSLRTRGELKNELRLALTTMQRTRRNPLKLGVDSDEALGMLLQPGQPGHLSAEQSISRAFRDLQAHQVALLAASRAALRGTIEHLSPEQLSVRFERDNPPLLATSGSRWRAYCRYHQALCQNDDWSERLFARDFALAYDEQVRLISTLHSDH